MDGESPRSDWRCVAATPWLIAGDRRGALERFLTATWELPSWVPMASVRHALSPLLPPRSGLLALLRALHGRLVVVNHSPVAAISRADAALVRGLVAAALDGLPPTPWPATHRGATAAWPLESRAAYAEVLAHGWLQRHDAAGAWRRAPGVAVALYEGPPRIAIAEGGGIGRQHAPDVRARIASRLPARTLELPRVVATAEYQLVVVAARDANDLAQRLDRVDADVVAALRDDRVVGARTPGSAWVSGAVLLPDATVVAAMDAPSRQRWAAFTGRAGVRDAYWFPDSWARYLEPGRVLGCVSAASVGRSMPGGRAPRGGSHALLSPAVERGVCVPPGYGLVDYVGTLGTRAVFR